MVESQDFQMGKLQAKQEDMARDIQSIKDDLKDLKVQVAELRVSFARYIGIGIGAIGLIEFAIKALWH